MTTQADYTVMGTAIAKNLLLLSRVCSVGLGRLAVCSGIMRRLPNHSGKFRMTIFH